MNAATLLIALVERSNEEVAAVLHERVRFRQGDGTEHHGSEAVLAMFARSKLGLMRRTAGGWSKKKVNTLSK